MLHESPCSNLLHEARDIVEPGPQWGLTAEEEEEFVCALPQAMKAQLRSAIFLPDENEKMKLAQVVRPKSQFCTFPKTGTAFSQPLERPQARDGISSQLLRRSVKVGRIVSSHLACVCIDIS